MSIDPNKSEDLSSDESEVFASCGDCNTPLDETRDGHEDDGGRCHNCYWEEENARARREKDIVELEPEYRPSDWLKKNRPYIWEKLNKKGTKRKSKDMSGGMTPEQQTMYINQLKRLGEIIVKRISDEIQKVKFLDVYSTLGDLENFTELENRYKFVSENISQVDSSEDLEEVIMELREIEYELYKERFDKELFGTFYEIELANFLINTNKRFPEDTIPHLPPGESKQLPDAAGPVGGKRKTRKSKKKKKAKKNKYTRSKKQKGGDRDYKLYYAAREGQVDVVINMLDEGADINKAQILGYTPLIIASQNGHLEVVRILLERGADINKAMKNGATPLSMASREGNVEIVELLKNYILTKQKKDLVTKNIEEYERPNIPTLRSLAFKQLSTKSTSEINKNKDLFNVSGKLGGKRKTRKSKKSKKRKTHKKK